MTNEKRQEFMPSKNLSALTRQLLYFFSSKVTTMPPSTRKKNRISYEEPDEDTFVWEDYDDAAFQQAEQQQEQEQAQMNDADVDNAKPPAQKKQKLAKAKDAPGSAKPPFEMLPKDILTHMMLFVDNARDIYALSMVGSKHIRGAITTEVAVRSAVFAGGKQQRRIEELVKKGIQKKAVYLPDTFRLLRLLNGRQCERLELCYNYNLETKIPSTMALEEKSALNQAHDLNFGMLLCKACAKGLSTKCGDGRRYHRRSVYSFREFDKLICSLQNEQVTGQPVGPLLHALQYQQLFATYGHSDEKLDQAVDTIIADIPEYQERYDNIINSYKAANDHYPRFIQSQRDIEIEKKRIKDQERAQRKLENQRKLLRRLERALGDYPHKDQALLNHVEDSNLEFYGPACIILTDLMDAPSMATSTKVQAAMKWIKTDYDWLNRHGFLEGPGYMKAPHPFPREEYQTILFDYARENLDPLELLKDFCTWCDDREEFHCSIDFLVNATPASAGDISFKFLMCFLSSAEIEEACATYLLKQGVQEDSVEFHMVSLWWSMYKPILADDDISVYSPRALQFKHFWEGVVAIQHNYIEYQSYPAVVDWSNKQSELGYSLDTAFSMFDRKSVAYLENGDFAALFAYQIEQYAAELCE